MFPRILTAAGVEWAALVGRAMTAVTAILGAGDSSWSAQDTVLQGRVGTRLMVGRLMQLRVLDRKDEYLERRDWIG